MLWDSSGKSCFMSGKQYAILNSLYLLFWNYLKMELSWLIRICIKHRKMIVTALFIVGKTGKISNVKFKGQKLWIIIHLFIHYNNIQLFKTKHKMRCINVWNVFKVKWKVGYISCLQYSLNSIKYAWQYMGDKNKLKC